MTVGIAHEVPDGQIFDRFDNCFVGLLEQKWMTVNVFISFSSQIYNIYKSESFLIIRKLLLFLLWLISFGISFEF